MAASEIAVSVPRAVDVVVKADGQVRVVRVQDPATMAALLKLLELTAPAAAA